MPELPRPSGDMRGEEFVRELRTLRPIIRRLGGLPEWSRRWLRDWLTASLDGSSTVPCPLCAGNGDPCPMCRGAGTIAR